MNQRKKSPDRLRTSFLLLLAGLAAAASAHAYEPSVWYSVQTDLPYGPDPLEKADLLLPRFRSQPPAVIYIHGGAWMGNDKSQYEGWAEEYARAGFAVLNINYRLARQGEPGTLWPAQLQDIQLAVRWLRAHAAGLGIDARRLCALGDSAGGHLALYLGSLRATRPGDRAALYPGESPAVGCVVSLWGPANLSNPVMSRILGRPGFLGGKSLEEDPALWRDASPYFLIQPASAPTFILQGLQDQIVPAELGVELDKMLTEKGVRHIYWPVSGNHEFLGTPPGQQEEARAQALRFVSGILAP